MSIGGNDVDAIWLKRHVIFDLEHRHPGIIRDQFHHNTLLGWIQMGHQNECHATIRGHVAKKPLKRLQPARRSAEGHHVEAQTILVTGLRFRQRARGARATASVDVAGGAWLCPSAWCPSRPSVRSGLFVIGPSLEPQSVYITARRRGRPASRARSAGVPRRSPGVPNVAEAIMRVTRTTKPGAQPPLSW